MSDAVYTTGTCVFLALIPLAFWFFFLRNTGERAHSSKWTELKEINDATQEAEWRRQGYGKVIDNWRAAKEKEKIEKR